MDESPDRAEGFVAERSLGFLLRRAQKLMSQQAEMVFEGRDLTCRNESS